MERKKGFKLNLLFMLSKAMKCTAFWKSKQFIKSKNVSGGGS